MDIFDVARTEKLVRARQPLWRCNGRLQSEDFVPFWIERFILGVSLKPGVDQFDNTERVTFASNISGG